MRSSTLSVLLMAIVCCFLLFEVAQCEDSNAVAEFDSPDFLMDKKAVRGYIKRADNKAKAAHDIHAMMISMGLKKRAKKFMKREKARMEKRHQKRRNDRRKNGISKRTDSHSARSHGGNTRRNG